MSSSWGPLGVPPQSFLRHCTLIDVKRLRELADKARKISNVINNEERASKLEEIKNQYDNLVKQYEGEK
jgi:2'-5' RNA ligase